MKDPDLDRGALVRMFPAWPRIPESSTTWSRTYKQFRGEVRRAHTGKSPLVCNEATGEIG